MCFEYLQSYCNSGVELFSAICVYNTDTEKRYTYCDVSRIEVKFFLHFYLVLWHSSRSPGVSGQKRRRLLFLRRNHHRRWEVPEVYHLYGRIWSCMDVLSFQLRLWAFLWSKSNMESMWLPHALFNKHTSRQQKQTTNTIPMNRLLMSDDRTLNSGFSSSHSADLQESNYPLHPPQVYVTALAYTYR